MRLVPHAHCRSEGCPGWVVFRVVEAETMIGLLSRPDLHRPYAQGPRSHRQPRSPSITLAPHSSHPQRPTYECMLGTSQPVEQIQLFVTHDACRIYMFVIVFRSLLRDRTFSLFGPASRRSTPAVVMVHLRLRRSLSRERAINCRRVITEFLPGGGMSQRGQS